MVTAAVRARPVGARQRLARQSLAGVMVALVTSAVVAYAVDQATVKGVAILIVVVGTVWFLTTSRPQLALAILMLYLGLLDGYLKLASGSSYVTLIRDVLLFALVIGLLVRAIVRGQRLPLPPLAGWVLAFVVIVLAEVANPLGGSLVHSLGGVRQHLEFVPLFFLTYAFVRTTKALRVFAILLAIMAAANGVAGFIQFKETPHQFAAWGPGYAQRVLGKGIFAASGRTFENTTYGVGGTRPFGLGSDSGDGGLVAGLAICGILVLAAFSKRRGFLLFAVAMAIGAIIAIVTSQDRAAVVSSVVIVIAFGFLSTTARNRVTSIAGLVVIVVAAVLVFQGIAGSVVHGGLRYQGLSPNSLVQTTNKARGRSIAAIPHNIVTYPLGAGLATAGPASVTTSGESPLTMNQGVDTETEFSFLIAETGIPGMVVIVGFLVTLLALGLRRCRHEPDREARALLAAIIAPVAGLIALSFVAAWSPSTPTGPYLWAVGGIVAYWLMERPAVRRREAVAGRRTDPPPPVTDPGWSEGTATLVA